MKKIDYLIVGQGLAGTFFAFELIKNNKSFIVVDEDFQKASKVSAGIFNPVVLKRFVSIWQAKEQVEKLRDKIKELEFFFNQKFLYNNEVLRIFHDEEEIKIWKNKAQTIALRHFLDEEIHEDKSIKSNFGFGKVFYSGRIDVSLILKKVKSFLLENEIYRNEKFDYSEIKFENEYINYRNIQTKHLVFCEGFQVKKNPFFSNLPILTDKGEFLKVKLNREIGSNLYKKKHFLYKIDENSAYLGGTYNPLDTSEEITNQSKEILEEDIMQMYGKDYEIIEQTWGFRPVSKDRRPILGTHQEHKNIHILNGLGTRGTLIGATFAEKLFHNIENQIELEKEIDVQRFFTK